MDTLRRMAAEHDPLHPTVTAGGVVDHIKERRAAKQRQTEKLRRATMPGALSKYSRQGTVALGDVLAQMKGGGDGS